MIKKILVVAFTFGSISLHAQNQVDALRYSTQNLSGTARYSAMGGAFGSLGGEFSALSSNPAGIGMYQFSEFTFTPSFNLNTTKSYFNDSHLSSYESKLSIGNLGLVFTIPQNNPDWKRINLGIGWNQLANYDNMIQIEGSDNNASIVNDIIDMTTGTLIQEFSNGEVPEISELAWETYLINPDESDDGVINGEYISNFSDSSKSFTKEISSTGSMNEFIFSIGGSYQEKLYIGATIGIPTFNYYEYAEYTEGEISDTSNNLRGMLFSQEMSVYGTGYNLKIGAIYRLSENIKLGGALHTPTFFNIEEDYNTSMTTFWKDTTPINRTIGYFPYNYNLITPLKASISASTVFNNFLISGEYELIDYSASEYFTTDLENANLTIASIYQRTENIKLGAEMNIKPFILRAGYAKYGSAFANKDFSRENFSYGIGINNGGYFFDIAYVLSKGSNEHLLYSEEYIEPINIVNTNHSLLFTLGFRY